MGTSPDSKGGQLQWIGLFGGPIIAAILYWWLPDQYVDSTSATVAFTHAGRATMALLAWMAIWWLTEAIDISATALLPIAFLPIAGAATIREATAPYGSDLIFLFMGGFILALSMQRWGLDKRIALMTLRIVGTKPRNMVFGFMVATALISAFVSNTATAAMMLPVGLSVIDLVLKEKSGDSMTGKGALPAAGIPGRNFALCLMLGIAYAASIGGVATIIGSPPNVFLVGYIRDMIAPEYRTEITFLKWMAIGVPLTTVFLPITWLLLTRVMYPIQLKEISGGREFIQRQYASLGKMSQGELITMIVFFSAAFLWIVRPVIANGWSIGEGETARVIIPAMLPQLRDAGIAIVAAMALFVLPVNWQTRTFTMDWSHASRLPWGILILFGGGLSLASAIEGNGVAEFIGSQTRQFAGVSPLVIVIVVVTAVIFFSELASNTATATTLVPILAAMAPALGVHPYLLIIPAGIAATCAFMMPVGTPPNAIVYGSGFVEMRQMIKAGFWLNIIAIGLITALAYLVIIPLLIAS